MKNIKVFFDLDETLAYTVFNRPEQKHVEFYSEHNGGIYFTIIRENSAEIINWARKAVGVDNVYILTAASYDYAREISRLAGWGFPDDKILSRETIEKYSIGRMGWGGEVTTPHDDFVDSVNLLIDNLHPRSNKTKIDLLNIQLANYLKIDDYYGNDDFNKFFKISVKKFILEKIGNP
jgi:hypothetical protein